MLEKELEEARNEGSLSHVPKRGLTTALLRVDVEKDEGFEDRTRVEGLAIQRGLDVWSIFQQTIVEMTTWKTANLGAMKEDT